MKAQFGIQNQKVPINILKTYKYYLNQPWRNIFIVNFYLKYLYRH